MGQEHLANQGHCVGTLNAPFAACGGESVKIEDKPVVQMAKFQRGVGTNQHQTGNVLKAGIWKEKSAKICNSGELI
jgi:hypothetical protein